MTENTEIFQGKFPFDDKTWPAQMHFQDEILCDFEEIEHGLSFVARFEKYNCFRDFDEIN